MAEPEVAVIGGGPGGYVAALRAAQLGKSVRLFERDRVGGLCLNWGCIPSKALLHYADVVNYMRDAERWGISAKDVSFDLGVAIDESRRVVDKLVGGVEGLLKEAGVETIAAQASFRDTNTLEAGGESYPFESAIIATGATTRALPGVEFDGERVITSHEALVVKSPPERAVIIGAGPVGVEFAHLWASYGSKVTIVEMLDHLVPNEDADVSRQLERSFKGRGIEFSLGTKVAGVTVQKSGVAVAVEDKEGAAQSIEADVVLVAIGFVPHTEGLGLEAAGVTVENGFPAIDDQMKTSVDSIYAIGDVTGKLMLAHVAMQQGVIAAEAIAGQTPAVLDYIQMPRATFCQPHVGSVGYTEAAAKEAGFEVRTGRFPFTALGKAMAIGETEGFAKVVVDEATGQVLGVHLVGRDVNDLLGEAALGALLETTTAELGFAVHAHPTMAEALKEAALAADGEAIHIAQRRRQKDAGKDAPA